MLDIDPNAPPPADPELDPAFTKVQRETVITNRPIVPAGVQPKNLKLFLYVGAASVLLFATLLSSRKQPDKKALNSTPQPVLQDNTQNNADTLRQQLADQRVRREQDAAAAAALNANTIPIPAAQYGARPDGSGGTQQTPQETPIQVAYEQAQADEAKRAYQSRFASNIAYIQPSPQATQPAQADAQANPYLAAMSAQQQAAPATTPPASTPPRSRDQIPATEYKRPAEINVNQAVGTPYVVYEGLSLDTVLMNRLDGDDTGPVKVLVSNPVYSHDHQHILIPEGTVVLGESRKIGASGFGQQRRIAVVFHRMIMPDGYSVDLDQFQGLNQIGEQGLKDQVNNHYLQIFGASIALGVISGAAEITQGGSNVNSSGSQSFTTGAAGGVSASAATVLNQFINIPPTITIREGHRVKVYFTQDLLLPAYENHRIPQSF